MRLVSKLPSLWQNELKRIHYRRQIQNNQFATSEPEYGILPNLIFSGNLVIDIGANVGHYTKRFSELVGQNGRVISFEPVPETFALLAANVQLFPYRNVTLLNAAISNKFDLIEMSIPSFDTGLKNFYQARLAIDTPSQESLSVITLSLDSLNISKHISLVKIDTEGHESQVIEGMVDIILRDHPTLIVETNSHDIEKKLINMGYRTKKLSGSPNMLFLYGLNPTNVLLTTNTP